MDQWRPNRQSQAKSSGVAFTEYALLLAMTTVLALGGISMLGDASHDLFAQAGKLLYKMGFGSLTPLKGSMKALALHGATTTDGVGKPGSTTESKVYLKSDGLRGLNASQKQFQALPGNPPSSLNAQEFTQIMPYTADARNIAQNYLTSPE